MRKWISVLLALCLLTLSIPFSVGVAEEAKPTVTIAVKNPQSSYKLGDEVECTITAKKPADTASIKWTGIEGGMCYRVFSDGHEYDGPRSGWSYNYNPEHPDDNTWVYTVTYQLTYAGAVSLEAYAWFEYAEYYADDDYWDYGYSKCIYATPVELNVQKGIQLPPLDINVQESPVAGQPLKLYFSVDDTDMKDYSWEDYSSCYVRYNVVNESNQSVAIAPRAVHEVYCDWSTGTKVVTGALSAGKYTIKAYMIDKYGNHADGPEATLTVDVDETTLSGIKISTDKDEYKAGETATITIHHDKATTFNVWIEAPDGEDTQRLDNAKATGGTYTYTTKTLNSSGSITVQVNGINGQTANERITRKVKNEATITADKDTYEVGDTVKLSLSAYKATKFKVQVELMHEDGTKETLTETIKATDGKATYEFVVDEKEKAFVKAVFWSLSDDGNEYQSDYGPTLVLQVADPKEELAAPTGVTAKASDAGAVISWTAVTNAKTYDLSRKEEGGEYAVLKAGIEGTTYTDATVVKGKTYSYRLTASATASDGKVITSPVSENVSFKIPDAPAIELAAPTGLTATETADGAAIAWTAATNAMSYDLSRKEEGGEYAVLKAGIEGTAYTDTTVEKDKTYYYRLTASATNADGVVFTSPVSNDVRFAIGKAPVVIPAAPTGLKVESTDGTSISLRWSVSDGAQKSTVYRKVGNGEYSKLADVTGTTYTDKTAKAGKLYSYRVTATLTNADGVESVSDSSAEKTYMLLPKISKITVKSEKAGQFTASWKKVSGATSYEVYYSLKKKAPKYDIKKDIKKTSDLTLTVEKLKAKKTYYVFVRAVRKLDNGVTVKGPWSKAVKIQIKKDKKDSKK